jgi:two-component system, OmpR family, sensor histidine kinase VicK
MKLFGEIRERPWRVTMVAVGGLLVGIMIAGVVGLLLNRSVDRVTEQALNYDVELEDEGDDLRVAVLEVRHYHRNITFGGPSRTQIQNFEDAYAQLEEELNELEEIGVREPDAPQPEDLRRIAEEYYADFRPAIDLYETDRTAFTEASDRGLVRIDEMGQAGEELDELGEQRWEESLASVDEATATATVVLLAVIGGLLLVGVMLAYAAVRVVNELRRLYADQQAAAKQLADAAQAKTDFLADASHELRTPLTVLRGNAEVGLALGGTGDQKEILEDIVKESGKMTRMVEDLLFLARSDSASLPLEMEPVPVVPFLTELGERAAALARERGAKLETDLSGGGVLEMDQGRVEQAVLILVDNAAKYGPPGGKVSLSSEARSGDLRLTVADEGPGIPEEELTRVFERFYRMDKTRSRKLGGSGLGLPIANTIVEAHGGRIEAESRVGKGTSMSICLPLISADDDRQEGVSPRSSTPQEA